MATINGSASNDTLAGTTGDDTINGLGGNDLVNASGGNDLIDGGAGTDSIEYRTATSAMVVDFAAGTITGGGTGTISFTSIERVLGGVFADRMSGNAAGQNLTGKGGNDTLWGAGGIDTLWGGNDADTFNFRETGTANADRISDFVSGTDNILLDATVMSALGASGNFVAGDARFAANSAGTAQDASDRVIYETDTRQIWYDADGNGAGARQLIATLQSGATLAATDIAVAGGSSSGGGGGGGGGPGIIGTAGNDTLQGTEGNDTIDGLGGDDSLVGGNGRDSLIGGAGNDTLNGFFGENFGDREQVPDTLSGGLGNDYYIIDNPGDQISDAGGIDTVEAIDMAWTLADGFENLRLNNDMTERGYTGIGNSLGNRIEATYAGSRLEGRGGNDTLIGGLDQSSNTLLGGDGNDSLFGAFSFDRLDGGTGNDTLAGDGDDIYVFAVSPGLGNADLITDFLSETGRIELDGTVHANLGPSGAFSSGDARFAANSSGTAQDGTDRVIYNTSNGQLWHDADGNGGGAAQLIATLSGVPGLAATDIVVVNGSSTPTPGSGINGTAGNDTLSGTSANDTINGLGGNDFVLAGSTGGSDVIDGGSGTDSIEFKDRATSAITVDWVAGTITGGSSGSISFTNIERVAGGTFNDRMTGNAAAQNLTGQGGADTLAGAGGADTLWGGGGNDAFIFREMGGANADRIADFVSGSDKVQLDDAAFTRDRRQAATSPPAMGASGLHPARLRTTPTIG